MKKNQRAIDAFKMFEEGKRKCDIAKEWGISAERSRQLVEKGRRLKHRKKMWGDDFSPRLTNILHNVGAFGSDEKVLFAYKSNKISVSGGYPTRNYGKKTKAELEEYLIKRGLLHEEDTMPIIKKNYGEIGLADLISASLNASITE